MDSSISSVGTEEFLSPPPLECSEKTEEQDFEFGNFCGHQSFSLAGISSFSSLYGLYFIFFLEL